MLLAAAYYGAAKLGQTLQYTASVAAIWPPAGVGIAALYLWGIRWWPGLLLGEILVNAELLFNDSAIPLGSLLGQQAGNMAEMIVGALLLRRLIGPRATLDSAEQVGGMLTALVAGTAISATVGTVSMLAGGVIGDGEVPTFWRTWFLGDLSGTLVIVPAALVWVQRLPAGARPIRTWEGGLLIASVAALGVIAVSIDQSVTYVAFPALIWAAFRFGMRGATLAIAIVAGAAIGITAHEVGPFFERVQAMARAVEEGLQVAGTFVAMNNRVSQSVPHLHVHVVPRRRKDGLRGFFWPRVRYTDDAEMADYASRIRDVLR